MFGVVVVAVTAVVRHANGGDGGGGGGGKRPSGLFLPSDGRTDEAACARMRAFSQKPKRDVASSNVGDGSFSFLRNLFDGRLTLFIAAIGRTTLEEAWNKLEGHFSNILEISYLVILAATLTSQPLYKAHQT